MENVGQKIKKLRELRNYTQEYMALNLNITQTAYCKIEKEESKLTIIRLNEIAQVLDVEPLQILTFDERLFLSRYAPKQKEKRIVENDNVRQLHQQEDRDDKMNYRMKHLESEIVMLRGLLVSFKEGVIQHAIAS
jgi:transcriptional regulator with XRE-family HTH domain